MNVGASRQFRSQRAILFDLDGTLVDSAPDIATAVNELLGASDLPPLRVDQVKAMIGGGVRKLVERAFAASGSPLADSALEEANRDMAPIYRRHLTRLTRLMPGVREVLTHFHLNGMAMGVVTNKPQLATREILLHFHLTEYLGAIVGGDAVTQLKPAPDALLLALDKLGVGPADALMVGDSSSDVGAARAAGMPVVLLRGGYTQIPVEELGADLVCASLLDLPSAMQRLRAAA
ncbi:phosphoglycolate phosphatase [Mesorhizobium sp. M1C.F.Ca.ET.193.01.1.1]|uniref:phosphoglycolate phosphatase n=1 Tax=unclassified Mesorhizobium TaxID=325217 RepID=UPI000FD1C6CB|nr:MULTISPECIES: phosphoglycolate phosphatase [unclassified Mesorhizobium]TGT00136.1 phosphoglycolate phosphatase [bacterium M00.F.Ca.ET.177.01.1.1]TGQ53534.1 phosphoglycolate phosphatase [Mesorhizobium sp. M1C.F.Ca.ET.210.01.1.1]TGQ70800.1 phosphoglycolate phosphatase [Mesorhizobium sp. M1C.F.Ca.ET.212.01.1.1]TGR07376.1 phosphoglycolate phosphatase [Mesorhizobium sp. M1C.F.Ca.ET.204.01.1.1]TGR28248.1 phosphoglycolate phosphatase [Mesorhizobium sp. M1C.F.Ca.ET.196.01.1.1]